MEELTDESPMPFGKYKGQKLEDVPASYLIWLMENEKAGRVESYIEDNWDLLKKQASEENKGNGRL